MESSQIFTIRLSRDLGDQILDEAKKKGIRASEEIQRRIIAGSSPTNMYLKIGKYEIPISEFNKMKIILRSNYRK